MLPPNHTTPQPTAIVSSSRRCLCFCWCWCWCWRDGSIGLWSRSAFLPLFLLELDMFKMAIPPRAPPVVQNTSSVGSFGFALHFLLRCDLKKLTVGWHTAGPFDDDSLPPTTYFFVPTAPLTTSLNAADRHPAALWHSEGVNCDWSSQIQASF